LLVAEIRLSPPSVLLPASAVGQKAVARKSQRGALVTAGALVTTGVALVVLAAVILVGGLAHSSSAPTPKTGPLTESQLLPGDCIVGPNLDLGAPNRWPDTVIAVPCTRRHLDEIFFVGDLWPNSLATYPGDVAVVGVATGRCSAAFARYVGIVSSLSEYVIDAVEPSPASDWASGDRRVVCMAYEPGQPLNYSIKGTHQ
jgi:hypothetical protein